MAGAQSGDQHKGGRGRHGVSPSVDTCGAFEVGNVPCPEYLVFLKGHEASLSLRCCHLL